MVEFNDIFTTLDQSRRLVNKCMPIDSANAFFKGSAYFQDNNEPQLLPKGFTYTEWVSDGFGRINDFYFPCWSIWRLVDISKKCWTSSVLKNPVLQVIIEYDDDLVNRIINAFIENNEYFDYSRLVEPVTK